METGLYVHVPFCVKKCNYCDFISYPYHEKKVESYLAGLEQEMKLYSQSPIFQNRKISTVYIGGGTPTCLAAASLGKIIHDSFKYFNVSIGAEVTMEANPGTVSPHLLASVQAAGVNRLSLGVQSCREDELRLLGRIHSFRQAKETFLMAREAGLHNIGVDLISGLPGQSTLDWMETLKNIIALEPDHVSAYGLQLEAGTPLYEDVQSGSLAPCSEEEELKMFLQTGDFLTNYGLDHYEISNFATPGRQCRHNLMYWHNQEYLGIGPAAHSFINGCRYANEVQISAYKDALDAECLPVANQEKIDTVTEMAETVFLGLRLLKGLSLDCFKRRFGCAIDEVYPGPLQKLTDMGLVESAGGYLRLTRRGLPVANRVFIEFLP
ncbi:MAG: radical SAM family heme chaperone HemW [Firmicutes bacterium]|nr:radical SAM family heme chaperone HemW [Bacillota bacterium]